MILSELINETTARLGTEVTTNFTEAKKTAALNTVRKRLILQFAIVEFIKESSVSVTAGDGTFPTDYLRTVKELNEQDKIRDLWDSNDDTFKRVSLTIFAGDNDKTWAIKQNTTGGTFSVYPSSTGTFTLRHYYLPTAMSDGSDDSGLPVQYDELHALLAARQLLFDDRQYDTAAALDEEIMRNMGQFNKHKQDEGAKKESTWKRSLNNETLIW